MPDLLPVRYGLATNQGQRSHQCDAAHVFTNPANGRVAAAVFDGIGSSAELAAIAPVVATVAARVGALRGWYPGFLAATELLANPARELNTHDGVMVFVHCSAGEPAVIMWVGDCRCYEWTGTDLVALTEEHTKDRRMLFEGASEELAAKHAKVPLLTVGRATTGTISLRESGARTLILMSDGVYKAMSHAKMTELVRTHAAEPQQCADALVESTQGARDNATVVVLDRGVEIDHQTGNWGR